MDLIKMEGERYDVAQKELKKKILNNWST